jgi:hypothetical protein
MSDTATAFDSNLNSRVAVIEERLKNADERLERIEKLLDRIQWGIVAMFLTLIVSIVFKNKLV